MALGNCKIANVRYYLEQLNKYIKYGDYQTETKGVYSCYNTYQYVANNLREWADDTVVGTDVKQDLIKLSNLLLQLIGETNTFINKMETFCDKQDSINGSSVSSKQIMSEGNYGRHGSGRVDYFDYRKIVGR